MCFHLRTWVRVLHFRFSWRHARSYDVTSAQPRSHVPASFPCRPRGTRSHSASFPCPLGSRSRQTRPKSGGVTWPISDSVIGPFKKYCTLIGWGAIPSLITTSTEELGNSCGQGIGKGGKGGNNEGKRPLSQQKVNACKGKESLQKFLSFLQPLLIAIIMNVF